MLIASPSGSHRNGSACIAQGYTPTAVGGEKYQEPYLGGKFLTRFTLAVLARACKCPDFLGHKYPIEKEAGLLITKVDDLEIFFYSTVGEYASRKPKLVRIR